MSCIHLRSILAHTHRQAGDAALERLELGDGGRGDCVPHALEELCGLGRVAGHEDVLVREDDDGDAVLLGDGHEAGEDVRVVDDREPADDGAVGEGGDGRLWVSVGSSLTAALLSSALQLAHSLI